MPASDEWGGWRPGQRLSWRMALNVLVLAAIPLILVVVNHLLSREFDNSGALAREVERSYQTRAQLQTVLSLVQDVETGQRGYNVTGDPDFLEPYEQARRRLGSEMASLQRMELQSAAAKGMPELIALTRQKLAFCATAVGLESEGRREEAFRLMAGGQGKEIMDSIRSVMARMDAAEQAEFIQRARDADNARLSARGLALALQTILVLLLLASAWAIMRNMAERRRAIDRFRDLSARQEAIFDAAKDAMLILDEKGIIQSLNPAAALMYGYGARDLVGEGVEMLFEIAPKREEVEAFLKYLQGRRKGEFGRVQEFGARRSDGTTFPTDVAVSPVELADGACYLAIVRDITWRKQVDRMKSEFVSTVSHELRTPLTSIAGSLGLLTGGAAGELPDRAARLIRIAHSNSERLVRLINDILDIEKIESGKMAFDLKRVSIGPLLDNAIQANRAYAADYGVELRMEAVPDGAAVIADEDRLMQVVTNLLSNAIKFSPPGEEVLVTVADRNGQYRITVADHGSGIPDEFRSRIFGKFAQADSSDTRQKGGTGLGLSIVREIVTRLGGSVSFDSTVGEGASFHVDLPAADQAFAAGGAEVERVFEEDGLPTILHIDDDPDTLRVVASAFEGRARILSTPSVQEAEASLQRQGFDAVILDLAMADGSGFDLLPLLRHGERKTPTIVFTARDTNPALAASVDAVLTKSRASLDELAETVLSLAIEGETPDVEEGSA